MTETTVVRTRGNSNMSQYVCASLNANSDKMTRIHSKTASGSFSFFKFLTSEECRLNETAEELSSPFLGLI